MKLAEAATGHPGCSLTACLNPLHPGPCKGWKGHKEEEFFKIAGRAKTGIGAYNVPAAAKRAPAAHIKALRSYVDGSGPINRSLRYTKGGGSNHPQITAEIAAMDKVMAQSKLSRPITVLRAISPTAFGGQHIVDNDMAGVEYSDHAFGSTGTDLRLILKHFSETSSGKRPVIANIVVPQGMGAVRMPAGQFGDEKEILLDRGAHYRVIQDHGWINTPKGKFRHVTMEVVPGTNPKAQVVDLPDEQKQTPRAAKASLAAAVQIAIDAREWNKATLTAVPPEGPWGFTGWTALTAAIITDEWGWHNACSLTACRNPLHPGPCKGWKHTLHATAPAVFHKLEQERVKRLNEKRLARIAALKQAGKPIPKSLLKEITYSLPKSPPEGHGPSGPPATSLAPHPEHLAKSGLGTLKLKAPASKDIGKSAELVGGDAHHASEKVSKDAGVKVNHVPNLHPTAHHTAGTNGHEGIGKVTLGQAIKTATPIKRPALAKTGGPVAKAQPTPGHREPVLPEPKRPGLAKTGTPGAKTYPVPKNEPLKKVGLAKTGGSAAKAQPTPGYRTPVKPEPKYSDLQQNALDKADSGNQKEAVAAIGKLGSGQFAGLPPKDQDYLLSVLKDTSDHSTDFDLAAEAQLLHDALSGKTAAMGQKMLNAVLATSPAMNAKIPGGLPPEKKINLIQMTKPEFDQLHPHYQKQILNAHAEISNKLGPRHPGVLKFNENIALPHKKEHEAPASTLQKAAEEHQAAKLPAQPAVLTEAQQAAHGIAHKPGYVMAKDQLPVYEKLTAEEFHGLSADTQKKIISDLQKGHAKFKDPKKKAATETALAKFGNTLTSTHTPGNQGSTPLPTNPAETKTFVAQKLGVSPASLPGHAYIKSTAFNKALEEIAAYTTGHSAETKKAVSSEVHLALDAAEKHHLAVDNAKAVAALHIKIKGKVASGDLTPDEALHIQAYGDQHPHTYPEILDTLQNNKEQALANLATALKNNSTPPAEDLLPSFGPDTVPEEPTPPTPGSAPTEADLQIVGDAYRKAWKAAAVKTIFYGTANSYSKKTALKNHPFFESINGDFKQIGNHLTEAAKLQAQAHHAESLIPTDANGKHIPTSPEYATWHKLSTDAKAELNDAAAIQAVMQDKLNTARISAGLAKRNLPVPNGAAVKAAAAAHGYQVTTSYNAPHYGDHESAKNFILNKVGPQYGVAHVTAEQKQEKAAATAVKKVEKTTLKAQALKEQHLAEKAQTAEHKAAVDAATKALLKKLHEDASNDVDPYSYATPKPTSTEAQKWGMHFLPDAGKTAGQSGHTSAQTGKDAYVADSTEYESFANRINHPDVAAGAQARQQFQWSVTSLKTKAPKTDGYSASQMHDAVYSYTGGGYSSVNSALNQADPTATPEGEKIKQIDAAMKAAPPLTADVVLYRGFSNAHHVFGKSGKWNSVNVAGMEWTQRSYSSTSSAQGTAESFAGGSGPNAAVMRIFIPKGMAIKGISAKGGQHPGENEVILQRGIRYRVVADYGVVHGKRRLDVEVIPNPYDQ